jgi:serine/threonine protein kinase
MTDSQFSTKPPSPRVASPIAVSAAQRHLCRYLSGKQTSRNVPAANNPMWQAPEVAQDPRRNGSKAGDVYSFGVVMYELMMMSRPWPATPLALISHHVQARHLKQN